MFPFKPKDLVLDLPRSFGWNTNWLAVRSLDMPRILYSLNLKSPRLANWEKAMASGHPIFSNNTVFITPPLGEWTLVKNYRLRGHAADTAINHLASLSKSLQARVGYFASYRGVDGYCWGLAENGVTQRLYGTSDGQLLYNYGELSTREIELGQEIQLDLEMDACDFAPEEYPFQHTANESMVGQMAKFWSIDPTSLHDNYVDPSLGMLAKMR